MTGNDHLGYAFTVIDNEIVLGQIDKDDTYLPTVIRIDGSGGIENSHTFFYGKSATGSYLSLESGLWSAVSYRQVCS